MRIIFFAEGKRGSTDVADATQHSGRARAAEPAEAQDLMDDSAEERSARSELDARVDDLAIRLRGAWGDLVGLPIDDYREEFILLRPLSAALKQLHAELDLAWLGESEQLVIRAGGARELYPLIELLCGRLNAALGEPPVGSKGARQPVVALSPPRDHFTALQRATHRLGRDFSSARVRVGFVRGHLLELGFAVPGCSGHEDVDALEAATSYAEAALGERVLDEWVGSIGVSPGPRGGPLRVVNKPLATEGETAPVSQLSALVGRGVEALTLGLPSDVLGQAPSEDWTLLDSTPIVLPDGSVSRAHMDDVLMAATRCPELLKCYLEGLPVSSRRFSRVGETFVYLKLPCSAPLPERPALREAVERELEIALGDSGVLVGNAVGTAHVYIVLALRDVSVALKRLLPLAPSLADVMPRGSTLRFLDAEWQLEWLTLR